MEDFSGGIASHLRVEAVRFEGGDFQSSSEFVRGGGAVISLERFSGRVHLSCEVRDGWMVLGIPVEAAGSRFNGEPIGDALLPLILSGGNGEWSAGAGASVLMILVEHQRFLASAERVFMATENPGDIGLAARSCVLRADSCVAGAVRGELLAMIKNGLPGGLSGVGPFEDRVFAEVARLIDSSGRRLVPCSPGASLLRRARRFLGEEDRPLRVSSLREALRVSPHTLQTAFKTVTGVSPKSFILCQRYSAARLALLKADPERDRVTDIAIRLGFTELGRFACCYREFFGESPSATLARKWAAAGGCG